MCCAYFTSKQQGFARFSSNKTVLLYSSTVLLFFLKLCLLRLNFNNALTLKKEVSGVATAEHIKNLIRAYYLRDDNKFKTVVLQIAAYEAKLGHEAFARELKQFVEKAPPVRSNIVRLNNLDSMLRLSTPSDRIRDLIVSEEIAERLSRILTEFKNRNRLQQFGLSNRRKILIEGAPGTGKTFTASVIASELNLPLYTVQIDRVVTKFMGETSAKLRQIFDEISASVGVYLFDEFDAIGADRALDNEVGEARRILNSFLQFIEQDASESIIIAATNSQKLLDQALFRRFDDVLHYTLPTRAEIYRLYSARLGTFDRHIMVSEKLLNESSGLSHAEIIRVCDDAIKSSILSDERITERQLLALIDERIKAYGTEEA